MTSTDFCKQTAVLSSMERVPRKREELKMLTSLECCCCQTLSYLPTNMVYSMTPRPHMSAALPE